jgi:hypothetical protein
MRAVSIHSLPSARQRIHAGVAQPLERLADRDLRAAGEMRDVDHRERLQMHLREALLEAAEHLAEPVERQFRMQAADDVELGHRLGIPLAGLEPDLLERHRVRLRITDRIGPMSSACA